MLRSLFTGISGLSAHQQMLDVASNNIANVNTTGYKSSSAVFSDTLSQTLQGASAGSATQGGTNGKQVGLGVKLAGVVTDFTQGSTQTTGRGTDMLVDGDGFFMVSQGGQTLYTRQGSYSLDQVGHLVTPSGGMLEDSTGAPLVLTGLTTGTYQSYSIAQDGTINAVDATGASTVLGQIGLATFANPAGLQKMGDSEYAVSGNSGPAIMGLPGTGAFGKITAGALEMSNVNLAAELTNLIIAERGYQANSRVISTSDEVLQTLVQLQ
ncbi:flagellar hook protein FlgE [Frankineae bacterium MT45]|nr:flagellar hook protein FlgE [Frankineae bacterium MT45]